MGVERIWLGLAALGGLLAVAIGAFGAHGVADPQAKAWMDTGATYLMLHSLAVFAAAFVAARGSRLARAAPPLFLAGGLIFCGTLFAMAMGAPRILGAVTPIGGLLFMGGWVVLAIAAMAKPAAS
ncbi:MAG: DUF423 domain-containing protein [Phenylobacterium sp.]|uniref:DUF423 domain-containing protein n=1 Tax=Phenylobacterium sp. TaxID=1871053 RepID=UPI0027172EE9|nr:DUF423 domain-containing protein [Phenylobacterium sp.]MDO8409793.1 DUF423 domain-containing protein [Phenylobacterium sp.]